MKRLFGRLDALLIAGILLLAALPAALYFAQPKSVRANIYVKGELYQTVPLDIDRDFTVTGNLPVVIRVEKGGIWFLSSPCHDQVCVRTGLLTRGGSTAACLPAAIVIRLTGDGKESDGVTY